MAVNRSVVRSVVNPVVNSIVSGIRRYFTELAASGSMHYTIPTVTLTGDYKKTSLVYFIGAVINLEANTANNNNRYRIAADGNLQWRADGTSS